MTDLTKLAQLRQIATAANSAPAWYPVGEYGDVVMPDSPEGVFCKTFTAERVVKLIEALEKAQRMEAYWKTQCRGITDHCEKLQALITQMEEAEQKLCAANVTLDARAELAERRLGRNVRELQDMKAAHQQRPPALLCAGPQNFTGSQPMTNNQLTDAKIKQRINEIENQRASSRDFWEGDYESPPDIELMALRELLERRKAAGLIN